jgi:mono/diheme cytochrome c family protein
MIKGLRQLVGITLVCLAAGPLSADDDLAARGCELTKKYCHGCHGATYNGDSALDFSNYDALIDPERHYVVAGDLEASAAWQRMAAQEMPPEDQPQPTPEEFDIIRQWMFAGAPFPQRVIREFIAWPTILQAIYDDLERTQPEHRRYVRYFTLTHLYNNVHGVDENELRLYRAALSKALNSACWEPNLVIPTALDPEQTLFRVDLRDLGWTAEQWRMILSHYPYGCGFGNVPEQGTADLYRNIEGYAQSSLCFIRADWFIARCMRPPVYEALLGLPPTAFELEQMLGCSVIGDFQQDSMYRAGFVESGVSAGNRIVDRHKSRFGYYWKSYDFKRETARGNIMKFPLGPGYDGHPYEGLAFEQDGGEMIFSLPNGLQGYYLCDAEGNYLKEGPIEVVRDLKETSGAPIIVNGLSCMACHRHGMISFTDTLRTGAGAFGDARRKLLNITPEGPEMQGVVDRDSARFVSAADAVTAPFLRVGDDASRPFLDFPEPVQAIARRFEQRLGLEDVACEILVQDPQQIRFAIQANPALRTDYGLGPLAAEERITRANWESRQMGFSPPQYLMLTLDLGTPFMEIAP